MKIQDYIQQEMLVFIPVIYLVGVALKKSKFPDKWIPLTLGGVSVFLAAGWILSTEHITGVQGWAAAAFKAVTQGILIAGASVYANQIYLQSQKKE